MSAFSPGRVQQLPRPRLAVLVDGWIELPIEVPPSHRGRWDLVVERRIGDRQVEFEVLTGDSLGERPAIPGGCRVLADVQLPRAAIAVHNSMIWDCAVSHLGEAE